MHKNECSEGGFKFNKQLTNQKKNKKKQTDMRIHISSNNWTNVISVDGPGHGVHLPLRLGEREEVHAGEEE